MLIVIFNLSHKEKVISNFMLQMNWIPIETHASDIFFQSCACIYLVQEFPLVSSRMLWQNALCRRNQQFPVSEASPTDCSLSYRGEFK